MYVESTLAVARYGSMAPIPHFTVGSLKISNGASTGRAFPNRNIKQTVQTITPKLSTNSVYSEELHFRVTE